MKSRRIRGEQARTGCFGLYHLSCCTPLDGTTLPLKKCVYSPLPDRRGRDYNPQNARLPLGSRGLKAFGRFFSALIVSHPWELVCPKSFSSPLGVRGLTLPIRVGTAQLENYFRSGGGRRGRAPPRPTPERVLLVCPPPASQSDSVRLPPLAARPPPPRNGGTWFLPLLSPSLRGVLSAASDSGRGGRAASLGRRGEIAPRAPESSPGRRRAL